MSKNLCKFFVLCLFTSIFSQNTFANPQVIFAVDLIRHGDRTPLSDIPTTKYPWPNGLGMLTKKGEKQLIALGQSQAKKYIITYKLLPQQYDASRVLIISTDFKRTIASANAFMKGFYPNLSSQNFKIYILKDKKQNFLITQPKHDVFSIAKLFILKHYYWHQAIQNLKPLLQQLSISSGMDLQQIEQMANFADNLYVRTQHNIPLPKWITREDADKLIALEDRIIVLAYMQREVVEPTGKMFLATIKTYFNNKISNKTSLNYVLLSGHDSSIMTVLSILGVPAKHIPPYASDLNFLLLEDSQHYFVKISLNNTPLYIPACGATQCTIEQFNTLAK